MYILKPTALPSDAVNRHHLGQDASRAYSLCRDFEERALVDSNDPDIVHARILGYLIIHSPSLTAQGDVVELIHTCNNNYATLSALASTFLDYFIRPFKRNNEGYKSPWGSPNSSPGSFDDIDEDVWALDDSEVPATQALIRDGYRCVVTGQHDLPSVLKKKCDVTEEEIIAAGGSCLTKCTYIVPDSICLTGSNLSDEFYDAKRGYAASVLAALQKFGYDAQNLNGEKDHSLYNMMTLELNSCHLFNRLELWFEETATPNCYTVKKPNSFIKIKDQVKFTTPDPINFPLPSPRLLALHRACAEVTSLSGAGIYIDLILEEQENIDEMELYGSPSEVLHHQLTGIFHS